MRRFRADHVRGQELARASECHNIQRKGGTCSLAMSDEDFDTLLISSGLCGSSGAGSMGSLQPCLGTFMPNG